MLYSSILYILYLSTVIVIQRNLQQGTQRYQKHKRAAHPKIKISPENRPSQKEI